MNNLKMNLLHIRLQNEKSRLRKDIKSDKALLKESLEKNELQFIIDDIILDIRMNEAKLETIQEVLQNLYDIHNMSDEQLKNYYNE